MPAGRVLDHLRFLFEKENRETGFGSGRAAGLYIPVERAAFASLAAGGISAFVRSRTHLCDAEECPCSRFINRIFGIMPGRAICPDDAEYLKTDNQEIKGAERNAI